MDRRSIGVFDSGFGGLTVLSELVSSFPHENFIYFGDTLRVPYGNKSANEILEYSLQISKWLVQQDVKSIVIACNTSSCIALPSIKKNVAASVLGMIDPGVESVLHYQDLIGQNIESVGIIGTKNTIASRAHENSLRTAGFLGNIHCVACPLFVPIVEEGVMDMHIWRSVLHYYLSPMRDAMVSSLLLACTHYPILSEYLGEFFEGKVQLLDPNYMLTQELRRNFDANDLHSDSVSDGQVRLCVTGSLDSFKAFYHRFFELHIDTIELL
jgi:glutamate racemase